MSLKNTNTSMRLLTARLSKDTQNARLTRRNYYQTLHAEFIKTGTKTRHRTRNMKIKENYKGEEDE